MGTVDIDELNKIAKTVRNALDIERKKGTFGYIPNYPAGLCGYASYALGYVLHEMYPDKDIYQVGGDRNGGHHSWVEYDCWIIDITADQFKDSENSIVIEKPGQSKLHNTFKGIDRVVITGDEGKVKGEIALINHVEKMLNETGSWIKRG